MLTANIFSFLLSLSWILVQSAVYLPGAAAETLYHPHLRQDIFLKDEFHYLSTPVIGTRKVIDGFDCSFKCLSSPLCYSYNLAASRGPDGKLWCELLSFDKYSHPGNYSGNQSSHHFVAKRPCVPSPCQNGGTCLTTRYGFKCNCKTSFLGELCETTIKALNSCKAYYDEFQLNGNQTANLTLDSKLTPVLCHHWQVGDVGCGHGVWTPVMKIHGDKRNFLYSSDLWRNKAAFNPAGGTTGLDFTETKLPTYWNTSFSEICLGMRGLGQQDIRFVVIPKKADSLHSLIGDGNYSATFLSRNKWIGLMSGFQNLQGNCRKEGFNPSCTSSPRRVRIGILGNNEEDCGTCDSLLGFGLDVARSCGDYNLLSHGTSTMGYILVK
ncbi:PREDICTED: uncharacterized protein LOC107336295 [Acropora digitifera]|uniref:uncharacterized protein LOC107336295 n=1 Tax=Acropora digitifera TaxID=70779 RepID=UPI00077AE17D|nr:PREDICTED: uncharacterized protein LOC107336295 [Acropora digitifera]